MKYKFPDASPSTLSELEVTILRVPESRFTDVLDHAMPIFLRDEPLSCCLQPCTTGRRERAFRKYSQSLLSHGLSLMAAESTQQDGRIVRVSPNTSFTKNDTNYSEQVDTETGLDTQNIAILQMLTQVYKQFDIFYLLKVDSFFEIGAVSVDPSHISKGLATQLVPSSLKLGVTLGGILSRMCFQAWQHDWSQVALSWE
uniref:N-acetyltransferase domain-containing protein n=1 Tax=Timema genevievae TaxID=629358 RepID=A0A7R9PND2_TIMGE|nr:unnamed protein product [Timema genevievae]